jgi:glycine/serine hydroxymethyltransferase
MLYELESVRDSIFLLCEYESAKKLTQILAGGCNVVSGGTDSHLILVDLRPKKITGNIAEKSLERAGITCNKNAIPFDPEKPMVTSGIRLGTPTLTSRGMGTGTQFTGFTSTKVQLNLLALLVQKYKS